MIFYYYKIFDINLVRICMRALEDIPIKDTDNNSLNTAQLNEVTDDDSDGKLKPVTGTQLWKDLIKILRGLVSKRRTRLPLIRKIGRGDLRCWSLRHKIQNDKSFGRKLSA